MKHQSLLLTRILLAILLLFVKNVASHNRECIHNLPPFVHQEERECLLLPVGIQALVPTYRFSCPGIIKKWGVAVERRGRNSIHLQVWRPSRMIQDSYDLVGANVFNFEPLDGEKLVYFMPDERRRLTVQDGDVIGLYLEDSSSTTDNFRVQCHRNVTGSVAHYVHSNAPFSSITPGSLNTFLFDAAPIITVHLDLSSLTSDLPPPSVDPAMTTPSGQTPPITSSPIKHSSTSQQISTENIPTINGATPTNGKDQATSDPIVSNSSFPTNIITIKQDSTSSATKPSKNTIKTTSMTLVTTENSSTKDQVIIGCLVVLGALCLSLLALLMTMLCFRKRRQHPWNSIKNRAPSMTHCSPILHMDQKNNSKHIDEILLTENPAYDHTHIGMLTSFDWLSPLDRAKLPIKRAHDYEIPIGAVPSKKNQKLEQSFHYYDFPANFLQSTHLYEEV